MTNGNKVEEVRIELKQAVILLVLFLTPTIASYIVDASTPASSSGEPMLFMGTWQGYARQVLFFGSLIVAAAIPILVERWKRGINFRKIWQLFQVRVYDKYLLIAFVPLLCSFIASALQHKNALFLTFLSPLEPATRSQIAFWFMASIIGNVRLLVCILALCAISDSKIRRWMLCLAVLLPLVIQEFFAQVVHLRFPFEDSSVFRFMLPQYVHWTGLLGSLAYLAIIITLGEVFRPSLRLVAIYLVGVQVCGFFVKQSSGNFWLLQVIVSVMLVLTAWYLKKHPSIPMGDPQSNEEEFDDELKPLQT